MTTIPPFIQLTQTDGLDVLVNLNHLAAVTQDGSGHSLIDLTISDDDWPRTIRVKHTLAAIAEAIAKAEATRYRIAAQCHIDQPEGRP